VLDGETLATSDASRERLRAVVEGLSDEDLSRPVDDQWTVAALLAHTAFFDRRAALLLRRCLQGTIAPSPIDPDAVNDAALPQWRLIPPRAAAEEALAAAEDVDGVVAGLTPGHIAAMQDGNAGIRLDRSRHRQEHLDQIERALGRA
jgi:hypothetical protein